MVSNIFYFHPCLGKMSNLTNIFQMGWNHQLISVFWKNPVFWLSEALGESSQKNCRGDWKIAGFLLDQIHKPHKVQWNGETAEVSVYLADMQNWYHPNWCSKLMQICLFGWHLFGKFILQNDVASRVNFWGWANSTLQMKWRSSVVTRSL